MSESLLSLRNPASAASTISTFLGQPYELEDMMEIAGIRYYMFYDTLKKCYLAAPGGDLTEIAPVSSLEISDTREAQTMLLQSKGSRPSFMLLCQLWLYASRFNQKPTAVTKIYGFDTEKRQSLYSDNVSDYCSDQERLQRYCDTLIPAVSSISSSDTNQAHSMTYIDYRKGGMELRLSPETDGLSILFGTK